MTRPMDLMVDIDDVIFPTMASIHAIGLELGVHDGTAKMRWRGWEVYGCDEQVYWDLWSKFALDGGYVSTPPIPGSAEALRWLKWEGHRIHLVTARGFMTHADDIRTWTPQWIEEFAIPHDSLTFAQDKVQAMIDLGVTFGSAIDDSPKNFRRLDEAGIPVFLQHHEHNEDDLDIPDHRRVVDLWEWAYRIEKGLVSA